MNNVYDLIETLSSRTAMYTGEHKLSNLRSFIDGYTFGIKGKKELEEFLSDFPGFHNWVAKKFGFKESTAGWQNMILAIEMGFSPESMEWVGYSNGATEKHQKAAVAKFYELVSEYKNA